MKNKISLLAAATIMFFSSCEEMFNTVVEYDIPYEPKQVVDFRYPFLSNEAWGGGSSVLYDSAIISLTKSMKVTGKEKAEGLEGANILLYENDVLVDSFMQSALGYYQGTFTNFVAGRRYKLTTRVSDLPNTEASQIMPTKPILVSKKITHKAVKLREYEQLIDYDKIEIEIADNGSTKDFYRLRFYHPYQEYFSDEWLCKQSQDPIFESTDTGDPINVEGASCLYGYLYFRDETFNGSSKKFTVFLPSYISEQDPNNRIYFYVENLGEDAYKYYRSFTNYWNNEGNPFAEPVILHSNVTNGFGVFTLSNVINDSL